MCVAQTKRSIFRTTIYGLSKLNTKTKQPSDHRYLHLYVTFRELPFEVIEGNRKEKHCVRYLIAATSEKNEEEENLEKN